MYLTSCESVEYYKDKNAKNKRQKRKDGIGGV